MAKKFTDNSLDDYSQDWGNYQNPDNEHDADNGLPYKGSAVQEFIKTELKKKAGYSIIATDITGESYDRYLYSFRTEADWLAVQEDPSLLESLKVSVSLVPEGNATITSNAAIMQVLDNNKAIISGDSFTVYDLDDYFYVRTALYQVLPGQSQENGSWVTCTGDLTASSLGYTNTWSQTSEPKAPYDNDNPIIMDENIGGAWVGYKLRPFLEKVPANTSLKITLTWKSEENKISISKQINVTYFALDINHVNTSDSNNTIKSYSTTDNVDLTFKVTGSIDKKIYVKFAEKHNGVFGTPTAATAGSHEAYHYLVSSDKTQTTRKISLNRTLPAGVYTGYAWVVNTNDATMYTEPKEFQFIVNQAGDNTVQFMIDNASHGAKNWSNSGVFDYGFTGGATTSFKVRFESTNGQTCYAETILEDVETGKVAKLYQQLSIPSESMSAEDVDTSDPTAKKLTMVVKVYRNNDVEYQEILASTNLVIDITKDFAPVQPDTDAGIMSVYIDPNRMSNTTDHSKVYNYFSKNPDGTYKTLNATFSSKMDWVNGGWTTDENSIRCLRLPAGSQMTLKYADGDAEGPYFMGNSLIQDRNQPVHVELDYLVKNSSNDDFPFFQMLNNASVNGSEVGYRIIKDKYDHDMSIPYGFIMYPKVAYYHTSATKNTSILDEDMEYMNGTRQHVVLSIIPNYTIPYNDYNVPGKLVRIMLNGVINREYFFGNDTLANVEEIVLGSDYCDVDIYNLRIYRGTALTCNDVLTNYISTLPSLDEKEQLQDINDIMGTDGTISYEKASKKYRTIVHVGIYPNYLDYSGNADISIGNTGIKVQYIDEDTGQVDTTNSFYADGMIIKGQGSTAKTYYKWNASWKFNDDDSDPVNNPVSTYHKLNSQGEIINEPYNEDGDTHLYWEHATKTGTKYKVDTPKATKLVGKVNYASSMQSHKQGSLRLYEDIRNKMGIKSSYQKLSDFNLSRMTVRQDEFLFFVADSVANIKYAKFYGLMTWGAGKGDKKTYGFDKKGTTKDCLWIGGATQISPIALVHAPWVDGDPTYLEEASFDGWRYGGQEAIDFEIGDNKLETIEQNVKYVKQFFNFVFEHSHRLKVLPVDSLPTNPSSGKKMMPAYDPSVDEGDQIWYNTSGSTTGFQYWLPEDIDGLGVRGDVVSMDMSDPENRAWLPAGVSGDANTHIGRTTYNVFDRLSSAELFSGGSFYALDTYKQGKKVYDAENQRYVGYIYKPATKKFVYRYEDLSGNFTESATEVSSTEMTEIFRRCRAELLRKNIGNYTDIDDTLLCFVYTLFIAASDNLSKNTYWVVDIANDDGKRLCRPWRDDDDTIFRINNEGQKDKSWDVEYDTISPTLKDPFDDHERETYFTATRSGMYGTLYYAYYQDYRERNIDSRNIPSVMNTLKRMIDALRALGASTTSLEYGQVFNAFQKYFFSVQEYFPAVAYNETARLMYEEAQMLDKTDYVNKKACFDASKNPNPISMSMGDSRFGEMEFMKMRIFYMLTFAGYNTDDVGQFGGMYKTGGKIMNVSAAKNLYTYQKSGDIIYPNYPIYVSAGTAYNWDNLQGLGDNNNIQVFGVKYYKSLGDWSGMSYFNLNSAQLNLASETAIEFIGGKDSAQGADSSFVFNAASIISLPSTIETLNLHNVETLVGSVDLSPYTRLKTIDLGGTHITNLVLPSSTKLESVILPPDDYLNEITINPLPYFSASTLSIETKRLNKITLHCKKEVTDANDYGKVFRWMKDWDANVNLNNATFIADGINWTINSDEDVTSLLNIHKKFGGNNSERWNVYGTVTLGTGISGNNLYKLMDDDNGGFGVEAYTSSAPLMFVPSDSIKKILGSNEIRENSSEIYKMFLAKQTRSTNYDWSIKMATGFESYADKLSLSAEGKTGSTITNISGSSVTLSCGEVDKNVQFNLVGKFKDGDGYDVTVMSDLMTATIYHYPTSTTSHIAGVNSTNSISTVSNGKKFTYSLAYTDDEVDNDLTIVANKDASIHGQFAVTWEIAPMEGTYTQDYYDKYLAGLVKLTKIDGAPGSGADGEAVYGKSVMVEILKSGVPEVSTPYVLKANIWYHKAGAEDTAPKQTIQYVLDIGKKLYDNWGYLYCSDGKFYRTLGDIPVAASGDTQVKPVGVVVVPARHTADKTSRVMSLNEMRYDNPDEGSTLEQCNKENRQGIIWGTYPFNVPDLKETTTVPNITGGTTSGWALLGSETNYNGNLKFHNDNDADGLHKDGDNADGLWYFSRSADTMSYDSNFTNNEQAKPRMLPSPFAGKAPFDDVILQFNPAYATSGTATADFAGKANTAVLISGATAQSDWRTASGITQSYEAGYYPAACCCQRYHVKMDVADLTGNNAGDWYLPSAGELGYIIPKFAKLNQILKDVRYAGHKSMPLSAYNGYWSSSECNSYTAWDVDTRSGSVNLVNYYKSGYLTVRAFLSVG